MSIGRVKTWQAGDILTAFDLNTEFNNIISNPVSLWSPAQQNVNFNGKVVTWDSGSVTTSSSTTASGLLLSPGGKSGTPGVTTGSQIDIGTQVFTDTNTSSNGTVAKFASTVIHAPTLTASSTNITTTDAATLYVDGPPVAGSQETLTNAWVAWFVGAVRIDGAIKTTTGTAVIPSNTVPLPVPAGGTGFGAYTIGDLLYADTAATLAKLNASTAGLVLKSNGPAVAPSWQTLSVSGITSTTHSQTISVSDFSNTTTGTTTTLNVSLGEYAFCPVFTWVQTSTGTSGTGVVTASCTFGQNQADPGNTVGQVTLTMTARDATNAGTGTAGNGILRWRTLS